MVRILPHPCDSTGRPIDRQPRIFDSTTIELRIQYLSKIAARLEQEQDGLVPVTVYEATPEDGLSYVPFVFIFHCPIPPNEQTLTVHRPNDTLIQSQFEATEGDTFLTFVLSFLPPPTTLPPPVANPQPTEGMSAICFVRH